MENRVSSSSLDITAENIEKLKELFPEVLTEGKIDFDMLRTVLGEEVDDRNERYRFEWHGKKNALLGSQQPSKGTLRPDVESSRDIDKTENLYIEGDNLEILKILQKSYNGKVKMIYIDPPYNTGKDFIYRDNFKDTIQNYMEQTGQVDSKGKKISTNTESNGRFHTDWLNMISPRLRLARNFLTDDGVIFISIDENEQPNLRKVCDEIFYEQNFICEFVWQNKKGGGNDSTYVAIEHEYILCYAKNRASLSEFYESYSEDYLKRYKEEDENGKYFWDTFKRKSGKQYYSIVCPDGTVLKEDEHGNPISWLRSETRFLEDKKIGDVRIVKVNDKWTVHFKQRLPKGKKPRSIFTTETVLDDKGTTSSGSNDIFKLFGMEVFSNPKPVELMQYLLGFGLTAEDYVMDFFSGSGTIAEAVMRMNALDSGRRKFILIQLDENLHDIIANTSSNKQLALINAVDLLKQLNKAPLLTEIGKERIRRAGDKIIEEHPEVAGKLDIGFKVLKLDKSNIREWNADFDDIEETLESLENVFVEDRTELDIVYEIMLKQGLELTYPLSTFDVNGKNIFDIGYGNLFICLDKNIDTAVVQAIIDKRQEYGIETSSVVLADHGFSGNDSEKLNCFTMLKDAGYQEDQLLTI